MTTCECCGRVTEDLYSALMPDPEKGPLALKIGRACAACLTPAPLDRVRDTVGRDERVAVG